MFRKGVPKMVEKITTHAASAASTLLSEDDPLLTPKGVVADPAVCRPSNLSIMV
jgi:hypothetical protein